MLCLFFSSYNYLLQGWTINWLNGHFEKVAFS